MPSAKQIICIIDDDLAHLHSMANYFQTHGFETLTFSSGTEFLEQRAKLKPYDLVISDINMPGVTGFDLCRALRAVPSAIRLPIILITGADAEIDKSLGLEAGADEFISKPYSVRHIMAKIRSLLDIRAKEILSLQELLSSKGLNNELKKFLSPNIANRFTLSEQHPFLQPHEAEVTVLFVDIRGFTAFSEQAAPQEVITVLQDYYTAVGAAAIKYKGTLGHLAGDGIMAFFNDPEPIEAHSEMAVRAAVEAREILNEQKRIWSRRNYQIDFGFGLSEGVATIGCIGFDRFLQYSVIGPVTNLASRLCHLATKGQILISHRLLSKMSPEFCEASQIGDIQLKGIAKPVSVYDVRNISSAPLGLRSKNENENY